MRRVTVAVAADPALIKGANHVHVLLSKAEGFDTYAAPGWQDADGNPYCVSSGIWTETQIEGVTNPEAFAGVIEDFAARYPDLDLGAVADAQAAFRWGGPATPGQITAVIHDDPQSALDELAVVMVEGVFSPAEEA